MIDLLGVREAKVHLVEDATSTPKLDVEGVYNHSINQSLSVLSVTRWVTFSMSV